MLKTAEKIPYFADGAPLFDRTATQRVEIEPRKGFNLLTNQTVLGYDEIPDRWQTCLFDTQATLLFRKNYGTKHVIVTDVKECPELVLIYERESTHQLKAWCVDTTISKGGLVNKIDELIED